MKTPTLTPTAFRRWFIAQFGPRSHIRDDDRSLAVKVLRGTNAQEEIDRRRVWDAQWEAATRAKSLPVTDQ